MPIKIPNDLPALQQLEKEKVNLIINETAIQQDIRPMKIILLNLMPTRWPQFYDFRARWQTRPGKRLRLMAMSFCPP